MTRVLRVFVNAAPADVPEGATALDCVRVWQPAAADDVQAGKRLITDSRGLPIPPDSPASAGSIYRTIPKRAGKAEDTDPT